MFELKHVTILRHPIIGTVNLDFGCNANVVRNQEKSFHTVLIGENGVGKSYLLSAIVEIFRLLQSKKNNDESRDTNYRFTVDYLIGGQNYRISCIPENRNQWSRNELREYVAFRNGDRIPLKSIELPMRVIASTMTISDKFEAKSDVFYKYKGVRSEKTTSTTGTRTLIRKTVDSIADALANKQNTRSELATLLNVLDLDAYLEIRYKIRYREMFYQYGTTPQGLCYLYDHQDEVFPMRKSELWGTSYFNSIRVEYAKLQKISEYICRLKGNAGMYENYDVIYYPFDLNDTLVQDKEVMRILTNLDILTFPELKVSHTECTYAFEQSSSGETQQLCQFLNIMSAITENSLILIDEPENSSHPNWQMNYIGWLSKIFHQYTNCHFVVATHSHFLLTDLHPENSRIIALQKMDDGIQDIADGVNTYCWSVDDILYNIFHVRNTRNAAFEADMYALLNLISEGLKDSPKAKSLVAKLSQYSLPGNDPLNKLLDMAR